MSQKELIKETAVGEEEKRETPVVDKERTEEISSENEIASNAEKQERLSVPMRILCYFLALCLVVAIVYGFAGIAADILKKIPVFASVDRIKVIASVGIIYFMFDLMMHLGNHWRSSEKNEIGTAVTNFPNPFYDPGFKKGPYALRRAYNDLYSRYNVINSLLGRSLENKKTLEEEIGKMDAKLTVSIRHNNNSNRIIRSLNYLYRVDNKDLPRKMLNEILQECITVLEKDLSDKSIAMFRLSDNKLVIKESVRINAESVSKRVFGKGEGFAGYIWEKGEPVIVDRIEKNDERFEDFELQMTPIGSILGYPLIVNDEFLGVLCLQSDSTAGFSESDIRTVEFYARMCTFILLYDNMSMRKF